MLRHRFDSLWNSLFRLFFFRFSIFFVYLNLCLNHLGKKIIFQFLINSFLSIKIQCILNFFHIASNLTWFKIRVINWCGFVRDVLENIDNTLVSGSQKFFILRFFWEWKTIFIIFLKFKSFDFEILIIFRNQYI